jgi:hypothetical protein
MISRRDLFKKTIGGLVLAASLKPTFPIYQDTEIIIDFLGLEDRILQRTKIPATRGSHLLQLTYEPKAPGISIVGGVRTQVRDAVNVNRFAPIHLVGNSDTLLVTLNLQVQ